MKRRLLLIPLVVSTALLSLGLMTSRSNAQTELERRFSTLDSDQDEILTPDELRQPELFEKLDLDGDGSITKSEAKRAFAKGILRGILRNTADRDSGETPETPTASNKESDTKQSSSPVKSPVREGPKRLIAGEHGIGRMIEDFVFTDLDDRQKRLSDYSSNRATVIAMTSTSCPISKKYLPTLIELANTFAEQNVQFLIVNPVSADKVDQMHECQKRFGNSGMYIFDKDGSIAKSVGAETTTDVIVIDNARTIVYHGAIDDQYGFGYSKEAASEHYLRDALEQVLSGKSPAIAATAAPGCTLNIKHDNRKDTAATYHGDIARLMQRHCTECHRAGGVGPFELESYDDVVSHAPMIREVIERGTMPPWFASIPETSEVASPWLNDRSLSKSEKNELIQWLDGPQLAGEPSDSPEPKTYPGGWLIGEPDDVFEFESPVSVNATGTMPYQNVTIDTQLEEDKWVQAIEVRPGDASVVHHVLVFVQSGETTKNRLDDPDDERSGYWGIYVPGNSTLSYPDGYAKFLPKGARLRFQMHYTPNGTATEDRTRIGLIYAKEPPEHEVRVASIANVKISIPPGADNHEEIASLKIPSDVKILALLPHMHLRGKAARYEVIKDSGAEVMLDIPQYDFNWQLLYRYAEPFPISRGDTIRFTAWYDNSENNPANPDSSRTVRWGPQTFDEMHLAYVEYIVPGAAPGDHAADGMKRAQVSGTVRSAGRRILFEQLDINADGFITRAEVEERMPGNKNASSTIFDRLDVDNNGKLNKREFDTLYESRDS